MFEYDRGATLDIEVAAEEQRGTISVKDISYVSPVTGKRIGAYIVTPEGAGPFAGVLFVHWYEPAASNSNRTQFVEEAVLLAGHGVVSLLVETFWSSTEWFSTRHRSQDYGATVKQTIELRRALDVLLAQPGIDPARVAVVGHDFGGMFGAVLAGSDGRPGSYAIMAATPLFSDWYLLGPPMPEPERTLYVEELSPLDPLRHIARVANSSFLFQFGRIDPYVPEAKALDFYNACAGQKQIEWYDADHDLDVPQAHRDRVRWVLEQLQCE